MVDECWFSEPCQISKLKIFGFCGNSQRFSAVNCYHKKPHIRCLREKLENN